MQLCPVGQCGKSYPTASNTLFLVQKRTLKFILSAPKVQVKALGRERLIQPLKKSHVVFWDSFYVPQKPEDFERDQITQVKCCRSIRGTPEHNIGDHYQTTVLRCLCSWDCSAAQSPHSEHCFHCRDSPILIFPLVNCTSTNSNKSEKDSFCKQNQVWFFFREKGGVGRQRVQQHLCESTTAVINLFSS